MINSGLTIIDEFGGLVKGKVYGFIGENRVGKTTILTCLHKKYKCAIVCNDTNEYESSTFIDIPRFKPEYFTDFVYCPDNNHSINQILIKIQQKIKTILESDIIPILIVDIKIDILKEVINISKIYNIPILIAINSTMKIPNEIKDEIIQIDFIKDKSINNVRKIKFKDSEELVEFNYTYNTLKKI